MSATPADLERGLRAAFPGAVAGGPLDFQIAQDDAVMQVALRPGAERVIAGLRLPTLRVHLGFTAGGLGTRDRMLARLELALRRGGG